MKTNGRIAGDDKMKRSRLLLAMIASALTAPALAQSHPPVVQRELTRLLEDCRTSGGRSTLQPGAVTRASLRDSEFTDFIIWSGQIDCVGAVTAFGGAAGQALVLIPGDGRGVRQVPAHSWRLIGEGPSAVEVIGGIDCAAGRQERCTQRLAWNGSAFAAMGVAPRIEQANAPQGGRSIVGDWAETRNGCASPMAGLVRIGSKSLTTDEMSCTFRDVSRSGSTVTWTGSCNESGRARPMTVTATESGGRLTIGFAGGSAWAPLMRCPRRS
jgi:hypothetical protein